MNTIQWVIAWKNQRSAYFVDNITTGLRGFSEINTIYVNSKHFSDKIKCSVLNPDLAKTLVTIDIISLAS